MRVGIALFLVSHGTRAGIKEERLLIIIITRDSVTSERISLHCIESVITLMLIQFCSGPVFC